MLLRYPGTKARLAPRFANFEGVWSEPFVGAGGMALTLATRYDRMKEFHLSDADQGLVNLWNLVISGDKELIRRIERFEPSLTEWDKQRKILSHLEGSALDIGFAKLTVHQMSYSGLGDKAGGPIGGQKQETAKWDIGCRWNPPHLVKKYEKIANALKGKCEGVYCQQWVNHLHSTPIDATIYLDPPYYEVGTQLYTETLDHDELATHLEQFPNRWYLSYDDHEWVRNRYNFANINSLDLQYTIARKRVQTELLISNQER